jgi:nucleoside diphosphate kinase
MQSMSALDKLALNFEELPEQKRKIIKIGGLKMPKTTNNQEVKQAKTRKVYEKTRGEHIKDVIIAVLITGVIVFVLGVRYANNQNVQLTNAVQAAQTAKK